MNALALVLGNANYACEKDRLINALNDADDFGQKLLNLGFVINKIQDCNKEEFERAIRQFGEDLKKYDIGLFYFSGHGLQIDGKNYLTSIDTSFADSISAKHTSFPLDEIIDYMHTANPIIKILILDACRDNPLPNQFRGILGEGLAPIYAPKGTIIAFSTSPGERAMDYGAGRNSIYTGALLNHIDDLNISIEDFFKRVRTTVYTHSNGKQTSWEHTSLIGNFCFNSGQLIHSVDLPYKEEHIADANFISNGTEIDEIIEKLRSHDWYKQQPAIQKLLTADKKKIDESYRFLLGRNILQTALGGEFSANSIFKNLDNWLRDWFIGDENHVLNGILFEIYFDSKGQFRQTNFKNGLIDEIFKLQTVKKYKKSIEFIHKQLLPFSEFIFYVPSNPSVTLPIEVTFEEINDSINGKDKTIHKLTSIKYQDFELMEPYTEEIYDNITVKYSKFIENLRTLLTVPIDNLRLSLNKKEEEIKVVYMPWELKLTKRKK